MPAAILWLSEVTHRRLTHLFRASASQLHVDPELRWRPSWNDAAACDVAVGDNDLGMQVDGSI